MTKVICIEGLIGVGKSTLLDSLSNCSSFELIREPVEQFRIFGSHNPLNHQYTNPLSDCGLVQLHIIQAVERQWALALERCKPDQIIISDRSLYSPNIFSLTLKKQGRLSQFGYDFLTAQVQQSIERLGLVEFGADKLFYINADPEDCQNRIAKRARNEEIYCDIGYLCELNDSMHVYIDQFKQCKGEVNVKVVDTSCIDTLKQQLIEFVQS